MGVWFRERTKEHHTKDASITKCYIPKRPYDCPIDVLKQ